MTAFQPNADFPVFIHIHLNSSFNPSHRWVILKSLKSTSLGNPQKGSLKRSTKCEFQAIFIGISTMFCINHGCSNHVPPSRVMSDAMSETRFPRRVPETGFPVHQHRNDAVAGPSRANGATNRVSLRNHVISEFGI